MRQIESTSTTSIRRSMDTDTFVTGQLLQLRINLKILSLGLIEVNCQQGYNIRESSTGFQFFATILGWTHKLILENRCSAENQATWASSSIVGPISPCCITSNSTTQRKQLFQVPGVSGSGTRQEFRNVPIVVTESLGGFRYEPWCRLIYELRASALRLFGRRALANGFQPMLWSMPVFNYPTTILLHDFTNHDFVLISTHRILKTKSCGVKSSGYSRRSSIAVFSIE